MTSPAAGSATLEPPVAPVAADAALKPAEPGRSLLLSVLAGLFVLGLVLAAGGSYVAAQEPDWEATSSFAVFPRSNDAQTAGSYYETLSRGQIVTTIAQVVAAQQRQPGTDLTVEVVPETSLVTLTATAPDRQGAELLAARGLRSAIAAVEALQLPFSARVVDAGPGTGVLAANGAPRLIAIVVLAALVLALAVQQALHALLRRR